MSLQGKTNAWIKPSGQFIAIGYMRHNKWASEYFEKKYGFLKGMEKIEEINGSIFSSYPYSALHKLGWIRLLTWTENETKALGDCHDLRVLDNTVAPTANAKQLETLHEWCKDNNYKFENLFTN